MPDMDDRVLVRFLRGRPLPEQVALIVRSWLADAPEARWPIAVQLDWPEQLTDDLAVNVRAMAAAKAVDETLAFDGLVTGTAERWLRDATARDWMGAANAALTRLQSPPSVNQRRSRSEPGLLPLSLPSLTKTCGRAQRLGQHRSSRMARFRWVCPIYGSTESASR